MNISTNVHEPTVVDNISFWADYAVTVSNCCTLIANQLNRPGGSTLTNIMSSLPCDARFMKWDNTSQVWVTTIYSTNSGWANGAFTLDPGEGAFLCPCSRAVFNLTFTGTVPNPVLPVAMVPGNWYLLSRQIPAPGTFDDITGLPPVPNTVVVTYSTCSGYTTRIFDQDDLVWYPSVPTTAVGTAMWVRLPSTGGSTPPPWPDVACPTNCLAPPSGISAWWPFDEASGPSPMTSPSSTTRAPTLWAARLPHLAWSAMRSSSVVAVMRLSASPIIPRSTSPAPAPVAPTLNPSPLKPGSRRIPTGASLMPAGKEGRTGLHSHPRLGRLAFHLSDGTTSDTVTAPSPDLADSQWHFIAVTVARCGPGGMW